MEYRSRFHYAHREAKNVVTSLRDILDADNPIIGMPLYAAYLVAFPIFCAAPRAGLLRKENKRFVTTY